MDTHTWTHTHGHTHMDTHTWTHTHGHTHMDTHMHGQTGRHTRHLAFNAKDSKHRISRLLYSNKLKIIMCQKMLQIKYQLTGFDICSGQFSGL